MFSAGSNIDPDVKSVPSASPPSPSPPSRTPSARAEGLGKEGKNAVGHQRSQRRPAPLLHHRHAPRSCGTAAAHSPYSPFTPSTPSTCETAALHPFTMHVRNPRHSPLHVPNRGQFIHPSPARTCRPARAAATVALVAAESPPLLFPIFGRYSFRSVSPRGTPGMATRAASAPTLVVTPMPPIASTRARRPLRVLHTSSR